MELRVRADLGSCGTTSVPQRVYPGYGFAVRQVVCTTSQACIAPWAEAGESWPLAHNQIARYQLKHQEHDRVYRKDSLSLRDIEDAPLQAWKEGETDAAPLQAVHAESSDLCAASRPASSHARGKPVGVQAAPCRSILGGSYARL